jgi:hypothetical protein
MRLSVVTASTRIFFASMCDQASLTFSVVNGTWPPSTESTASEPALKVTNLKRDPVSFSSFHSVWRPVPVAEVTAHTISPGRAFASSRRSLNVGTWSRC